MLITKQETELNALKLDLEETKRNCHCILTSNGKKTTFMYNRTGVLQRNTTPVRKGKFILSFLCHPLHIK